MHFHAFDQYHARESSLHRLDPRVKVLLTIGYILSNALLPDGSWLAFAAAWLLLLWGNHRAHLGLGYTFRRSFVALPFVVAAISAIFSPLGNPLAEWNFGFVTLIPTDFGVVRFFSILARSWLSVQMAILLVTTTQFPDLIHAFEHLKAPRTLTTIIAFLYRYLFVLTDEAYRLMRAREARSAGLPGYKRGGSLFWRAKITGEMAGQLFLRSYERSDRIYNAMLARGYRTHTHTQSAHDAAPRLADAIFFDPRVAPDPTHRLVPLMPVKHQPTRQFTLPDCENDILDMRNLNFAYPDGHIALQDVNLNLCSGEKVALVGPNGAGKSTLILHINGILRGEGNLRVGGLHISDTNLPMIRALVGVVFQNPDDQLFSPTVFDDVAFGPLYMGLPEEEIYRRVAQALAAVQMEDFGERLSHHLSMGQKKRIAIATVLSMQPQILVLDEPSAGLDPRARRALINLLHELPQSMLVSTHDLQMVQELFPRMVIMNDGRVVADGPTAVLLDDAALLEAHGLEML